MRFRSVIDQKPRYLRGLVCRPIHCLVAYELVLLDLQKVAGRRRVRVPPKVGTMDDPPLPCA